MARQDIKRRRLCRCCKQIPLDIRQLRQGAASSVGYMWELGDVSRIRQSKCRFCRFINFILYEETRTRQLSSDHFCGELILRWNYTECFKLDDTQTEIYYSRNSEMDFSVDNAFRLVPNACEVIDFKRVRAWMDKCKEDHGEHCIRPRRPAHSDKSVQDSYPELGLLRFIDVQDQCVVETLDIYPYVALSYVWGSAVNLRALERHKGLIPRTISDAMALAQKIGERYIWCDALCLIQNDPDDVDRGIKSMDLIYENAELTVVAACGHDANAVGRLPGVRLGAYISLDQRMKHSVYSSRAWTFQEQLLSARCLFFIDDLVYFRCRSHTIFESFDPAFDNNRYFLGNMTYIHESSSLLPTIMQMSLPALDFEGFIEYYTERSLTNQEDILNALGGIIQRLSKKMKCRFLEGLPTAMFDRGILFTRRGITLHRRHGFPSYSWAGWKGVCYYHHVVDNENRWLTASTWIVWYRRSHGILNLVWDILANEDFPYKDDEYTGYRKRGKFQSPVTLPFPTGRTQPTEGLACDISLLNYPVLQFWTLSASFNIRIVDRLTGNFALIIDRFGHTCGGIYVDDYEALVSYGSAEPYELIAISATPLFDWTSYANSDNRLSEMEELYGTECYYNAGRCGIGFAPQKGFITNCLPPGVEWKEIILG
ncbi:HET-domain-containing protein [Ustulina deusta]|nr:HET-domain-containing protein [Ustulina deusta]